MMKVIRATRKTQTQRGDTTFTGDVWKETILPRGEGINVGTVHFTCGARTHWHEHEGGQLLIITAGEGLVGSATNTFRVFEGDIVWTPGGIAHWHGASPHRHMAHTAVSIADVEWLTEVSDAEYEAADVSANAGEHQQHDHEKDSV